MRCLGFVTALVIGLATGTAMADGGQVVLSESAGALRVTLLAAPAPLRAGPVDLSVLVQDEENAPVFDAAIEVSLHPPDGHEALHVKTEGRAANRLFQELRLVLDRPGTWQVGVETVRDERFERIEGELSVEQPLGGARRHWVAIVLGPLGALVVAVHQLRVQRRSRPRVAPR